MSRYLRVQSWIPFSMHLESQSSNKRPYQQELDPTDKYGVLQGGVTAMASLMISFPWEKEKMSTWLLPWEDLNLHLLLTVLATYCFCAQHNRNLAFPLPLFWKIVPTLFRHMSNSIHVASYHSSSQICSWWEESQSSVLALISACRGDNMLCTLDMMIWPSVTLRAFTVDLNYSLW